MLPNDFTKLVNDILGRDRAGGSQAHDYTQLESATISGDLRR